MNIKLVYEEETTKTMLITPEIAKIFKSHNYLKNRKIRRSKVNAYANDMRNNRWNPMSSYGDPILFDDKGIMKNGQHRIEACIEANVPFETRVIFGIHDPDDNLYQVIDNGCPRRTSDVIDVPNANSIASIAKVFIALNEGVAPLASSLQGKISVEDHVISNVTKSQIIKSIEENSEYFQENSYSWKKIGNSFWKSERNFLRYFNSHKLRWKRKCNTIFCYRVFF